MKRRILTVLLSVVALFTFSFGFAACEDGKDGLDGIDGVDGRDGEDGAGVYNAYIDDDGHLILQLTDGKQLDCGKVRNFLNGCSVGLSYSETEGGYRLDGIGEFEGKVISVPATYKNKPVVEISEGAFSGSDILSVVIPDPVVKIDAKAFYDCKRLKKVSFGGGLAEIGASAFGKCENLETVNVTDLGVWCGVSFENMSASPMYFAREFLIDNQSVTELVIPDTAERISDYAFYECDNITGVNTGSGVKSIGDNAFYNCGSLESVTVGDGVTYIGDSAFLSCTALECLTIGGGVEEIAAYAFSQCEALKEVEIPSNVKSIGECAFSDCTNLESVDLNEGLKTLGDAAFCGCVSLSKFIMPDSVTAIGYGVLMFSAGDVGFGTGEDYSNKLKEIVISDNLKEITDFAFSKSNIESAVVGKSVATIRYSSFFGCGKLTSVVLPKSLTRIQSYSFYQCGCLNTVYYEGTDSEWNKIFIGANGNDELRNSTVYYYSESKPLQEGNFWHYADGVPVVW